jgi:hypothetical protein
MSDDELTQRVERLEAIEGVRDLLCRYAVASDSLKAANLADLFTEDVILRNPTAYEGRETVVAYYDGVLSSLTSARHHIVNSTIDVQAPDRARHRGYFLAVMFRTTGTTIVFGDYDDLVVRGADGAWRFKEKGNYGAGSLPIPAGEQLPNQTPATN